ncbi:MAG TPA: S8 family serine peptidase, partial [bacterium]
MRSLALLVLCSILLAAAGTAGVIQSDLEAQLSASAPNEMIHVMITMQEQGDSDWLMRNAADLDRRAAREFVVDYLSEIADRTQADVKAYLQSKLAVGQVKNLQSVFIVNLLHCYATPEVIRGLEKFSEIAEVSYDPERYLLAGVESFPQIPAIPAEVDEIAWGVADINAPAVWAMGYNGTGVIVSVTDTGVNYNHVDLADHMWNGGPQYPNHGYDFYSNDNDPMDNGPLGHGTHVAGTVASDGTAGSQCGVAPNAIIMAVKVLSGGGNGTEGM